MFSLFCNFLNIWNMVIITDFASSSASCDIHVNSGSASIGWLFSSLWVVSSCCFVWLVIFYWIPGIMTFTLQHGENVCIPYEYSWALFWDVVKSLRNSLRLSNLALLICWAGLVQFSILKLVSAIEAQLCWEGYWTSRELSLSSLAGGNRLCSRLKAVPLALPRRLFPRLWVISHMHVLLSTRPRAQLTPPHIPGARSPLHCSACDSSRPGFPRPVSSA